MILLYFKILFDKFLHAFDHLPTHFIHFTWDTSKTRFLNTSTISSVDENHLRNLLLTLMNKKYWCHDCGVNEWIRLFQCSNSKLLLEMFGSWYWLDEEWSDYVCLFCLIHRRFRANRTNYLDMPKAQTTFIGRWIKAWNINTTN